MSINLLSSSVERDFAMESQICGWRGERTANMREDKTSAHLVRDLVEKSILIGSLELLDRVEVLEYAYCFHCVRRCPAHLVNLSLIWLAQ